MVNAELMVFYKRVPARFEITWLMHTYTDREWQIEWERGQERDLYTLVYTYMRLNDAYNDTDNHRWPTNSMSKTTTAAFPDGAIDLYFGKINPENLCDNRTVYSGEYTLAGSCSIVLFLLCWWTEKMLLISCVLFFLMVFAIWANQWKWLEIQQWKHEMTCNDEMGCTQEQLKVIGKVDGRKVWTRWWMKSEIRRR